jgi:protein ImuB
VPIPDTSVPADRPFALIGSEERGLVLTAVNAESVRQGLAEGLGLADARAICPHLLTAPASPKKDEDALLTLASWASARYSPILNADGDDGLWLDVTGVPHLFGGEAALLADLGRRLARAGLTARLALAETLGAAHALSRFSRASPLIVPDGKIGRALLPLPVEALRLEPEIALLLKRLGLKRIGQLYDLPRASLERRFHSKDAAETVLLRLDQALGGREEPRAPLLPAPDFVARLPFPDPLITHDGVVAGLDHLSRALCRRLARAGQGARRVGLWVCRADGSSFLIEAGLSAPSCEPKHLLDLLQDKVEAIDMGFGVDLMALAALLTETLTPSQTTLAESDGKARPEPLIDRLVNRLGARAVRRLYPRASHIPELAQRLRSAFAGPFLWPEQPPRKPPRPPLLLSRPEPLEVLAEIPEGPPARFTWRRVTRRVIKTEGPERIAPEWWRALARVSHVSEAFASSLLTHSPLPPCGGARPLKERSEGGESQTQTASLTPLPTLPHKGGGGASGKQSPRPRDYYRIEDEDGRRYWVFREGLYQESEQGLPSWFLHGVFG